MTHDTFDGDITTEGAFTGALRRVLLEAMKHDVDPEGSWVCRNSPSVPDWEVLVVELEKPERTD